MPREKIKLASKGKTEDGKATRTFYTTTKNKKTSTEKLSLKKFDPRAFNKKNGRNGAHVDFVEEKIK
jgi:large subunit ribosomal protein L33